MKKKLTVFGRALPTEMYLTFPRPERSVGRGEKKIQAFFGQKSCENLVNSDCFQFILRCEKSQKDDKNWVVKSCSAKNEKKNAYAVQI